MIQTMMIGVPQKLHVANFREWRKLHPEDFGEVPCPKCKGTGYDPDNDFLTDEERSDVFRLFMEGECERCEGSGTVIGDDAASVVYWEERRREAKIIEALKKQYA